MPIKEKIKISTIIQLIVVMIFSIYSVICISKEIYNENIILISKVIVVISIILYVLINLYLEIKFTEPIFMLLWTIIVFGAGRIILDLFGLSNFDQITWFSGHTIDSDIKFKVLCSVTFSIMCISLGNTLYLLYKEKKNINTNKKTYEIKEDYKLYKIAKIIFYITLIPFLYKNIYLAIYVIQNGYMSLYTDIINIPGGSIINISTYIFKFSFYIILASMIRKKEIQKILYIYLVCLGISLLSGARGMILSEIMMIITYISYRNDFKVKVLNLIIIAIVIILLSFFIGNIRSGKGNIEDDPIQGNPIINFIDNQGFALNVLSLTIENEEDLEKGFDYIVHPVFFGDFGKLITHKFEDIRMYGVYTHSLQHELSYLVNSDIYMSGGGLGGNYIGELYMVAGIISVIVGNIIIGIILGLLKDIMLTNKIGLYFALYALPYVYFMPRHYTLGFMEIILRPILVLIVVLIIKEKNLIKIK